MITSTRKVTREWQIQGRRLILGERTLIMGILNVTPDSFSDGSRYLTSTNAVRHAHDMIAAGADIIDIGGESTRPNATPVYAEEELRRVLPVIEEMAKRLDKPISIDTTKSAVARAALNAGASIVNDISALRFDVQVASEVAKAGAGLVLMHSRGTQASMHRLPPVSNILDEVTRSLRTSIAVAQRSGVKRESIVIDPGIGFGKSQEQNIELLAKLDQLGREFKDFPIMIGTSRKSFLGRLLDGAPVEQRLYGTIASTAAAILKGADIVRVHDVKAAVEACRVTDAIKRVHK